MLFVDEIHRMPRPVEEVLYPALEDFNLDVVLGKGPTARSIRLELPRFTLVGATTRPGRLTLPLRERFGFSPRLDYYSAEELAKIVMRSAGILAVPVDGDAAAEIARRSRGTPRIANRLLRRVRDFAEVRHDGSVTLEVAAAGLEVFEVDDQGLDRLDHSILRTLIEKFGGGPVGLSTLAAAVGEETDTVEDVVEPYLLQLGFLRRTPAGPRRDGARVPPPRRLGAGHPAACRPGHRRERGRLPGSLNGGSPCSPCWPRRTQRIRSWDSLPLLLIGVVFYFLLIRPQNQRRRAQMEMQSSIEVGDEIVTTAGIYGTITEIDDDYGIVTLEVAPDTEIRLARAAVATRLMDEDDDRRGRGRGGRRRAGVVSDPVQPRDPQDPAAAVRTPDEPAPRMPVEPVPTAYRTHPGRARTSKPPSRSRTSRAARSSRSTSPPRTA